METLTPSIRGLAEQLLAIEVARKSPSDAHAHEAVRICEKLKISLTRFAGSDGFTSLLQRSLTLARASVPALQAVKVKPDGTLDGFEVVVADATIGGREATVAITAHLLGLLVTFIGESLTLRMVREIWPEASLDK